MIANQIIIIIISSSSRKYNMVVNYNRLYRACTHQQVKLNSNQRTRQQVAGMAMVPTTSGAVRDKGRARPKCRLLRLELQIKLKPQGPQMN